MNYDSEFAPTFERGLSKLDKQVRERILKAISEVLQEPRRGSQLVFVQQAYFKWRIGDYRIIYRIDEKRKVVIFLVIDHRSRVYKRYGF